jgi:Fic family protein
MPQVLQLLHTQTTSGHYLHWDKLRRHTAPAGYSHREWWLAVKLARSGKPIILTDKKGNPFSFALPDAVLEQLHQIDLGTGGLVSVPEPITNPHTRDRYLVSSLMEEAITSSQLEGAATTREVAKDLIRTGRKPRDNSEQMILNNFRTMQKIREWKDLPLTPELVFDIHQLVTENTMEDPSAAGRLRREDEKRVVADDTREVYHDPPDAGELPTRLLAMCAFANKTTSDSFIHPAVRAILLHFWLAYDHPFVDGNGRTARALFYWSMLHAGYWLFEFISISTVLRKAPVKYGRSFLYTETDDNDLTYFLLAQAEVMRNAVSELHQYIQRKTDETRQMETQLQSIEWFNHRQVEVIQHALKHPGHKYVIAAHQKAQDVAYQTARTDLMRLAERGILEQRKRGKQMVFVSPADLAARLRP